MQVKYKHPDSFSTDVKPTLDVDNNRVQYNFNALMARKGLTFFFVDHLFEKRPSGIHGAVGTRMSPIHEEMAERRKKEYLSKKDSPLKYVYEEQDTSQSWDRWIKAQFDRGGFGVIYDNSYAHKYGDKVKRRTYEEDLYEADSIVFVNCVGGGRMFNDIEREFDVVYDDELLNLVIEVEENGLENL